VPGELPRPGDPRRGTLEPFPGSFGGVAVPQTGDSVLGRVEGDPVGAEPEGGDWE
jgi:hypothetical protein